MDTIFIEDISSTTTESRVSRTEVRALRRQVEKLAEENCALIRQVAHLKVQLLNTHARKESAAPAAARSGRRVAKVSTAR